jgi:hypothetical protein
MSWKLKFCFWPKYCSISGRSIWLEYAYQTTRMISGPGEPVFEHRWYSQQEFLLLRIRYGNFGSVA